MHLAGSSMTSKENENRVGAHIHLCRHTLLFGLQSYALFPHLRAHDSITFVEGVRRTKPHLCRGGGGWN